MRTATAQAQTFVNIQPHFMSIYYRKVDSHISSYQGEKIKELPRQNKPKRFPSIKTQRKIRKATNWLVELANEKEVYNPKSKSIFNFKVNFITLTLPCLQMHTDKTIKKQILDPLLTNLRNNYQVNNYVWRAECQSNGNIHFHLLTDSFIHHYNLRRIWNNQLRKLGYITRYQDEFKELTFEDYCKKTDPANKNDLQVMKVRYDYGKKSNWSNPNTTDIHSIYKVKNIAAYVSKYLSKGESKKEDDGRYSLKNRRIEGRKVGISEKLSRIKGVTEEVTEEIKKIIDFSIDWLGAKIINEEWYSIVCISFDKLRGKFDRWVEMIKERVKEEVDYTSGGISKARLEL